MLRTLLWGFHQGDQPQLIERLRADGLLDPVTWIAKHRAATHDIREYESLRVDRLGPFRGLSRDVQDRVELRLPDMIEVMNREDAALRMTPAARLDVARAFADHFGDLIAQQRPDLVMMVHMPHRGPELILHDVARAMDIPVLMVHPHLAPNRFSYLYDIADFGRLDTAREVDLGEQYRIPRTFEKDYFYMPGKVRPPARPLKLAGDYTWRQWKRGLRGRNFDWSLGTAGQMWNEQRKYRKHLHQQVATNVDLSRPFVYFPLHLQPEMTTAPLGGRYVDQLLAIEELRTMLPSDWHIYVKENPKQTAYRRGQTFFERLARLPNVSLVETTMNTHELTARSQFVATITGTAGWEAISGGRPVLVFGQAWYGSLPGVFHFHAKPTAEEITSFEIDHTALEAAYNTHLRKTRPGIVEPNYRVQVDGFSPEKNLELLYEFYSDELTHFEQHGVGELATLAVRDVA